jgi:hypothetical protein
LKYGFADIDYLLILSRIRHIDVKPITSRPAYAADYALKGLKYGFADIDYLLILPRSRRRRGEFGRAGVRGNRGTASFPLTRLPPATRRRAQLAS